MKDLVFRLIGDPSIRWIIGYAWAIIVGGILTHWLVPALRRGIPRGPQPDSGFPPGPWTVGLFEQVFFTTAVAFELQGAIVAMFIWMTAKMVAHWNAEINTLNIVPMRLSALLGNLSSLFFALTGGLICNGKVWAAIAA